MRPPLPPPRPVSASAPARQPDRIEQLLDQLAFEATGASRPTHSPDFSARLPQTLDGGAWALGSAGPVLAPSPPTAANTHHRRHHSHGGFLVATQPPEASATSAAASVSAAAAAFGHHTPAGLVHPVWTPLAPHGVSWLDLAAVASTPPGHLGAFLPPGGDAFVLDAQLGAIPAVDTRLLDAAAGGSWPSVAALSPLASPLLGVASLSAFSIAHDPGCVLQRHATQHDSASDVGILTVPSSPLGDSAAALQELGLSSTLPTTLPSTPPPLQLPPAPPPPGATLMRHPSTSSASSAAGSSIDGSATSADTVSAASAQHDAQPPMRTGGRRASSPSRYRFPCTLCDRKFTRRYNLEAHLHAHQNMRPFQCTHAGCGEAFVRKYDLTRHVDAVHSGRRFGPCPVCGMYYTRADALRKHVQRCGIVDANDLVIDSDSESDDDGRRGGPAMPTTADRDDPGDAGGDLPNMAHDCGAGDGLR
ncbi:hypothetical protein HK105_208053 [Polyrhizophydium stewartii]|uniref:C2H2-type domain-containing protein n=1 Tax=Polyrhizophydium stewartii TaxID=2732419 RepID=A0ABR4MZ70_9FUNG